MGRGRGGRREICIQCPPPPPLPLLFSRMSDLYRHMRQQSRLGSMTTPTTDEDTIRGGGAWSNVTSGGRGGKKGDILKLVRKEITTLYIQPMKF